LSQLAISVLVVLEVQFLHQILEHMDWLARVVNALEVDIHFVPSYCTVVVYVYLVEPLRKIVRMEAEVWPVSDQVNVKQLGLSHGKQTIIVSVIETPKVLYISLQVVLIMSATVVD
jgi:hypothetical protein